MKAIKGTGRLLRLALRLDRIRLPIWLVANIGLVAVTIPQLKEAYGTEAARTMYALATSPSVVTRMLGGALTGPSLGEITIIETFFTVTILIILMNIFLVVRHTRANEEANRTEVIGSTPVGRQASLTAALLLAMGLNVLVSALLFLVLRLNGYELAGSLNYSLGIGALGMTFAVISAITAQLFESARAASGAAGLAFGVFFMLRAIGDTFGQLLPGGLGVKSNPTSWLSPLGWVTNMKPFSAGGDLWWPLLMFAGFIVFGTIAAYWLLDQRDVGAGLFVPRKGRLHASKSLLSRFGLVWRLNRTASMAWFISLVATGAALGGIANEFADLIANNEEMQQLLARIGGGKDVSDIMFGATFVMVGIAASGYALQILTRMRAEESTGRLELTLSTGLSRWRWLMTYVLYAVGTNAVILAATGLAAGVVYGIVDGNLAAHIKTLGGSIMVYVPAVSIMVGASLVIFGLIPRLFVSAVWGLLAASLLIFQIGALLNLPSWVINLSPFSHTPSVPAVSIDYTPLLIQTAAAISLVIIGLILFRRRDVLTS